MKTEPQPATQFERLRELEAKASPAPWVAHKIKLPGENGGGSEAFVVASNGLALEVPMMTGTEHPIEGNANTHARRSDWLAHLLATHQDDADTVNLADPPEESVQLAVGLAG